MKVNLIKSEIDKITEPGDYRDLKLPGFIMTVAVNKKTDKDGNEHTVISRYFKVNARVKGGKVITCKVGQYGVHSPAWARDKATKYLALMKEGINPNELFREEKRQKELAELAIEAEKKRRGYSLWVALDDYLSTKAMPGNDKKQKGMLSDSTVKLYRQMIWKHLADWLEIPLEDITREMVTDRYSQLCASSPASAGNTFRALRGLFNWVIEWRADKGITKNPVKIVWQELEERGLAIENADLKAWWLEVSKDKYGYHSDYFKLLLLTGLRKNELAGMKWADVDFSNRFWTVRNTKNSKDHELPFTLEAERILSRRYKERTQDIYVFPGKGEQGTIKDVENAQKQIIEATGIEFTPHALRRTFLTCAVGAGCSEYSVKQLANHRRKNDVTQKHYVVKRVNDLRPVMQSVEDFIMGYVNLGNENNKVVSINLSRGNSISKPAKN